MEGVFIVFLYLLCALPGMLTAAHAARVHPVVWRESGHSQMRWMVLPLVAMLFFAPIAIGVSIAYVRRVLPELRRLQAVRSVRPATF